MSGDFEDWAKKKDVQLVELPGGGCTHPAGYAYQSPVLPSPTPPTLEKAEEVDLAALWALRKEWQAADGWQNTENDKDPRKERGRLFHVDEKARLILHTLFKAMYGDTRGKDGLGESARNVVTSRDALEAVKSKIEDLEEQRQRYSEQINKSYTIDARLAVKKYPPKSLDLYLACYEISNAVVLPRPVPKEALLARVIRDVEMYYIGPLERQAAQIKPISAQPHIPQHPKPAAQGRQLAA